MSHLRAISVNNNLTITVLVEVKCYFRAHKLENNTSKIIINTSFVKQIYIYTYNINYYEGKEVVEIT